jgi:hypothetical protein
MDARFFPRILEKMRESWRGRTQKSTIASVSIPEENFVEMISFIAKDSDGKEYHLTAFPIEQINVPKTIPTRSLKNTPSEMSGKLVVTDWHIQTDQQEEVVRLEKGRYRLGSVELISDDANAP